MACSDGDPLLAMPMNTSPESFPSGNRPWSSEGSAMNLRAFEADGLTLGELSAKHVDVAGTNDEFR
jgi:hypothetical protein